MSLGDMTVTRTSIALALSMVGLALVLAILPAAFKSFAGGQNNSKKALANRTVSREDGIENYDIRIEK